MPKLGFMMNPPYKYASWADFDADLAALAELGYDGAELSVSDPARLDLPRLAQSLANHGLTLAGITTGASYFEEGLCLTSPDAAIRARAVARLKAHTDWAAPWGATLVIGQMQGFQSDEPDRATANARTAECLRQVAEYAGPLGVRAMLEPVDRFEVGHNHTAAEVLEIVEAVNLPALGIMLDSFHINIEESSLDGPVHLAGQRLGSMHVVENHRGRFSTGHLDLGLILRTTLEIGFQGYWTLGDFGPGSVAARAGAAMDFLRRAGLVG